MEGYIYIGLTVILWGVTAVIDKLALKNASPLPGLFIRSCTVFFLVVIFFYTTGHHRELAALSRKTVVLFVLSGLIAGFLGMLTYYSALRRLPSSTVVPLSATYPLFAALLAFLFLKEPVTLLKFLGIIFIVAGIWLVK